MLQNLSFALAAVMPAAIKTGLFTARTSVFKQDGLTGASGAPSGNYSVPVLTSIASMDAVPREASIEAGQTQEIKQIQSHGFRHLLLAGNYYDSIFPLIEEGLQAQVTDTDGGVTTYNLLGAEPDSQRRMTRLHLEVITV